MNNFITYADFKIDIALPINTPQIIDSLENDYIPKYQKEILKKLLGYTLYVDFETGLAVQSPINKWLYLRDGTTYQDYDDNGVLQYVEFLGCKEIVKYYVYCKFLNDLQNKVTPTGAITQKNENSTVVPATFKIYEAWNNLCYNYGCAVGLNRKYFQSFDYLMQRVELNYENNKLVGSAYNYIARTNELSPNYYENFNFTEITRMNLVTF